MTQNIKNQPKHEDDRGEIQMISESFQFGSISRITTLPEKGRAGHYHLNDGHLIIINEGQIEIYERTTGCCGITKTILNKGDIHFTGPMVDHYMWMPVYTVFDCYSIKARDTNTYESETIKIKDNLRELFIGGKASVCGCNS